MEQDDQAFTECTPEAFRQALRYLYEEAMAAGWVFPAHFIGVAAEAMKVYDGEPGNCMVIPFDQIRQAENAPRTNGKDRGSGRW